MLTYDDLGRLLSHTDSMGNQVQYEYDEMSRVKLLEPAQGTNYRTEYVYNENGSLATVSVFDSGLARIRLTRMTRQPVNCLRGTSRRSARTGFGLRMLMILPGDSNMRL